MIIKKDDPSSLRIAVKTLKNNGIAIIPCDTIYGIAGIAPFTENRIRLCKGRDEKPFIRLISSPERIEYYSDISPDQRILTLWPGPLTLILPGRTGRTYAVRVPDDPFILELLENLQADIFSTSVNISGRPPLWKIEQIKKEFSHKVDLIIDDGDLKEGRPSTILDITLFPYRILRQGECIIPEGIPIQY